jgi:hypothetical protein
MVFDECRARIARPIPQPVDKHSKDVYVQAITNFVFFFFFYAVKQTRTF